jgi:hypothetical protein
VAEGDEGDEVLLEMCSPEYEWWRDDGEERQWLELVERAEEGEGELESEGERCGVLWGVYLALSRGRGSTREAATGCNRWWLIALSPLTVGRG